METKNASQQKICRKRVVTKNELKRILTYYTSQLPCVTEACKVEKRELNSLVKNLQEEIRAKDASIKTLRENLSTLRLAIREFSCFIASNHPGTKIAIAARTWEKRWKAEDEEGLWNIAKSPIVQSAMNRHRSTKLNASSVENISTANTTQPEKAQFVSSQQNNTFHEFARKNATAVSRVTNSSISRKSSTNLKQVISSSLSTSTNKDSSTPKNQSVPTAKDNSSTPKNQSVATAKDNSSTPKNQSVATAHVLITVNQPLNLAVSSVANNRILMLTNSQCKTTETNNSLQINGQDIGHSSTVRYLRLSSAKTKRKNPSEPVGIKKIQRSETVSDVIVLSDDESDEIVDIIPEDIVTIPRYDSINSLRCKKSHPLVYPRLRIYPGLRISRLHITWLNSFEANNDSDYHPVTDITKTKHIILNVQYAGEYSKQIFHILYYIRSMVEREEAKGWIRIYSKECVASGKSRLRIQFDHDQTWFNDAIYFTGFIECGLERYGAYADVCKVELGSQNKQVPNNFTRRHWP
uniref:Bm8764 n=1 Tax=Brugia malayi TaxID=6279 RepID=A0A0H5S2B0_BRUMA|nr:Bm8764 [Brugia malayi]